MPSRNYPYRQHAAHPLLSPALHLQGPAQAHRNLTIRSGLPPAWGCNAFRLRLLSQKPENPPGGVFRTINSVKSFSYLWEFSLPIPYFNFYKVLYPSVIIIFFNWYNICFFN